MQRHLQIDGFPIDHVLYGGTSLQQLEAVFETYGVTTEYGGSHGNGITHNSLLGFEDGSYTELLGFTDPDQTAPRRDIYLRENVGPCGWALEADDVAVAAERLRARDITVEGPVALSRELPDGQRTAWNLLYLGEGEPGAYLPFVIEDTTPRSRRISPQIGTAGSELVGIGGIIIGVADLNAAIQTFRDAFALPEPAFEVNQMLHAEMALFSEGAIALAAGTEGWLADRVNRFGNLVCAFLIGSTDFEASVKRYADVTRDTWRGRRIGWLPPIANMGGRVGVIEV